MLLLLLSSYCGWRHGEKLEKWSTGEAERVAESEGSLRGNKGRENKKNEISGFFVKKIWN